MADKIRIAKKINEIVKPYCCADWCVLKEILASKYSDPRFFTQLKCIEHFKYEESERLGTDIGWQAAHLEWVDQGYAKLFAEHYHEETSADDIYNILISIKPIGSCKK